MAKEGAVRKNNKHGLTNHELCPIWRSMMNRVYNPKDKGYKLYGERGITVCKSWHDVRNFVADMHPRPPKMTLERVNNHKGYSPSNCVWASAYTQSNNRRSNVVYRGETSSQASKRLGGSGHMVDARVRRGWSLKKAFTTPSRYESNLT